MPLFGKKKKDTHAFNESTPHPTANTHPPSPSQSAEEQTDAGDPEMSKAGNGIPPQPPDARKMKYTFHCQLAHGSPTGIISGFTNVKQLYEKIGECYDMDPKEILFCTLNTHKLDMDRLLGGQIGLDDFIFVHVKGQKKEIEVVKFEDALGLTITDNGAGYAFIKRIKPNSVMDKAAGVEVGDHIEKIDGEDFVGRRHFDVAKRLKEIPRNSTFVIRLISPTKNPFSMVSARSTKAGSGNIGSGKKTLRLRANGNATEEEAPNTIEEEAIKSINKIVEQVLGIEDEDMAQTIWDIGHNKINPSDFVEELDKQMGEFGFNDATVFDFWGAISDAKRGRPRNKPKPVEFTEEF